MSKLDGEMDILPQSLSQNTGKTARFRGSGWKTFVRMETF